MRDDSCTSGFNAGNDEQGHQFANLSNLPPPSSGRQVQSCPPAAIHVSRTPFFLSRVAATVAACAKISRVAGGRCACAGASEFSQNRWCLRRFRGGARAKWRRGKGASETQSNGASDSARIVSSSSVGKDDMWSSAGLSLESWASPPQPPTQAPVVAARFRQVVVFRFFIADSP